MAEITGISTFTSVIPPEVESNNELPYSALFLASVAQHTMVSTGLGVLPVCCKCKEPAIWHSPPESDGTLFHCPVCKKRWKKDGQWEKDKKANLTSLYGGS